MRERRACILLCELDDPLTLGLFGALYPHTARFDVLAARTADVRRVHLERERVEVVVISATRGDAVEAIRGATDRAPTARVVAVGDLSDPARADQLRAVGADHIADPRGLVAKLAQSVVAAFDRRGALSGSVEQLSTADLIQTLCMSRRSLVVRLTSGDQRGAVWLDDGSITHAVWEHHRGVDALRVFLRAERGSFSAAAPLGPTPDATLEGDWRHVVLEALRVDDEAQALPDPAPDERPAAWRKRYETLTELGIQSLKSGDLARAQQYWSAARDLERDAEPDDIPAAG